MGCLTCDRKTSGVRLPQKRNRGVFGAAELMMGPNHIWLKLNRCL